MSTGNTAARGPAGALSVVLLAVAAAVACVPSTTVACVVFEGFHQSAAALNRSWGEDASYAFEPFVSLFELALLLGGYYLAARFTYQWFHRHTRAGARPAWAAVLAACVAFVVHVLVMRAASFAAEAVLLFATVAAGLHAMAARHASRIAASRLSAAADSNP